ncbi:MAG: radical SAM protein [Candidatus Omnitrophota bacterium]|jgi:radical SAM superfamily enzyme YgiQ (UPF0313 family)
MNIAFVFSSQNVFSPEKPLQYQEEMNFGISYISSLLKKHGHRTALFVLTKDTPMDAFRAFINDFKPAVLCFSAVTSEFPFVTRWIKNIKAEFPRIFLLGGGCHLSLNPSDGLETDLDAVCIGEGEYPTLELVEKLEGGCSPSGIENFWFKHNGKVERNRLRPFREDIDEFPFPDREMWYPWTLDLKSRPAVLLGRGCPFQCTYCSNHALKKLASGAYVRCRSADNIIAELKEIAARQASVREVYFEVETFNVNMPWALELCRKLAVFNSQRTAPLEFGVNIRVTPNTDFGPLFTAMRGSGFTFINVGVESGSERIRREIMKRHYSNDDIIRTASLARDNGLKVHFLNMIGLPTETEEDIRQTIAVNRACQPDMWPSHSIFFPYPGTEIHRMCRDMALLPERLDVERERSRPVLNLKSLPKRKLMHYFVWFDYYVYKGHRPRWKLLARCFVARLHCSYRLMRVYRAVTEWGVMKKLKEHMKK